MLFFLIGPFAFFSNLRFAATYNPIEDISLKFSLTIKDKDPQYVSPRTYEFDLYQTDSPVSIKEMSEEQFNRLNYNEQPETKFFEQQQVQVVQMKSSSEYAWQASDDYKKLFQKFMTRAANQKLSNTLEMNATLSFVFKR